MPARLNYRTLAALGLAFVLSACAALKGFEIGFPEAAQLQHGESVARKVCSACHAVGGEVDRKRPDAPTFIAISRKYSPSGLTLQMDAIAAIGHYSMPAIPLSAKDQHDLVVYIGSLRVAPEG